MKFSRNERNRDTKSRQKEISGICESQPQSGDTSPVLISICHSKWWRRSLIRGQLTVWASLALCLLPLLRVCDGFSVPAAGAKHSRHTTILYVIEAEAPSVAESPTTSFQPYFANTATPIVSEENHQDESSASGDQDSTSSGPANSEARAESDNNEEYSESEEDEQERLLERTRKAAALLSRRKGVAQRKVDTSKSTSVGARRVGSASRARGAAGAMTRLADAVRKGAGANTVGKPPKQKKKDDDDSQSLSSRVTKASIRETVNGMIKSSSTSMGLLGEESITSTVNLNEIQSNPPPGTVLIDCLKTNRWKASDRVTLRTANQSDDAEIANLRLSVFSNFAPSMRHAFVSRSCHVLSTRRNQGATCIVATVPRYGSILSTREDIILGTAECSIHEFYGTALGDRRLQNSILYITEVAVSPTARRKGIGGKIMESIDELAKIRGVETLYLHVDVSNRQAMSLYENSGFKIAPSRNPLYSDFTRSLNLHDGAMKGRNHYLMSKDLLQPTWLPGEETDHFSQRGVLGIEVSA